ncbi:MAG: ADP-ribosylation factor-like protein [Candidatus Baldrarchaeota archaeon]
MINEVYILFNDENPLVHAVLRKDNVLDSNVIMDLLEVARKNNFKLQAVTIQDKQIVFKKMGNFVAIIVADELDDKKILEHYAERILKLFSAKYGPDLEHWNGDVSTFSEFIKSVEKIVLSPKGAVKIVFVGSPGVGKTTLIKLLSGEENLAGRYIPTLVTDVRKMTEVLTIDGEFDVFVWDIPGQAVFKELWKLYLKDADLIVLVTDSTEEDLPRVQRLMEEIEKKYANVKDKATIIVIANKQDLPGALKPEEVENALGIKTYGSIAIDKSYRPKIMQVLANTVKEIANKKLKAAEEKIGETKKSDEILQIIRDVRDELIKYLPINDPIFINIDYWIKYLAKIGEVNEEDYQRLVGDIKCWRKTLEKEIEKYHMSARLPS